MPKLMRHTLHIQKFMSFVPGHQLTGE